MTKLLYFRLALGNLWKNRQTYLPFLTASTLLIFSMYSFLMITFNPGLNKVRGGVQFLTILMFGAFVVGLFSAIFLFYANSFLIKRRKREMGLYGILGMEKKHIARVLRHELSVTWLCAMLLGIGLGILLTRLLFLLIRLALRVEVPLVGTVSMQAILVTAILFAALYVLLIIYNSLQVRFTNPIELFRGGQTGEKEPKARWPFAVLGLALMGGGYYMAQAVQNPMAAIALFFVAVLMVILGTYLLFFSGSIAVLRLLKRNRRYYYQPRHFVTISGMLYRMKQNAAGLASIAILCTMAMVTIGTTVAMYNGSEKMLDEYYPFDMQITLDSPQAQAAIIAQNETLAEDAGVTIQSLHAFTAYETTLAFDNGQIFRADVMAYETINDYGKLHSVLLLTEATYAALTGEHLALEANEIALFTTAREPITALEMEGDHYALRRLDTLPVIPCMSSGTSMNKTYMIVPEEATAQRILLLTESSPENRLPRYTVQWNISGAGDARAQYAQAVASQADFKGHNLRIKDSLREEWYALHGGFLFIGIFLGSVFLMGTALIIYFKQISEGYQDHDRFIILQKVGMSSKEVRATVRRQILLVFFLPLLVAAGHVAGSLNMMVLMLSLFGLMDVPYIAVNTFAAALGVAALYWLFYHHTAKTYYRMVKF